LRRRLGLINADPLEPLFKAAYWATCSSMPGLPQGPSIHQPLLSEGSCKGRDQAPVVMFAFQNVVDQMKEGRGMVTQGNFQGALDVFRSVLQSIPLGIAKDATEEKNLLEMIEICREYINAMRLEVTRKGVDPTSARCLELAAYMTCCNIQPGHKILTLRVAMTVAFKAQNFVTAASFAKRLVQGNFGQGAAEVVAKARQLLQVCEAKGGTDAVVLNFDTRADPADFKLCSGSMSPIAAADVSILFPYCGASYLTKFKGSLCENCKLSEVGANTLGIQLRPL